MPQYFSSIERIALMAATIASVATMCLFLSGTLRAAGTGRTPALLPWPQTITLADGAMPLTGEARIVARSPQLAAAAELLRDDIHLIAGLRLATGGDAPRPGDIVLDLDPALNDSYTLDVTDRLTIRAGNHRSAAWAGATVLQLIDADEGGASVPRVAIRDRPHFPFPGLMIDVARERITLDTLRQCVILCQYYKIPYLQLHLSDDQGFTFPSTAFPQAGSKNRAMRGPRVEVYDLDALRDLVRFADKRGVTIIPELELPGHSGALQRSVPEIFAYPGDEPDKPKVLSVINLTNEAIYPALDTLIGEIADVFKSSPYIHIGCDEVYFGELAQLPEAKAYIEQQGLKNVRELYPRFINRMNAIVKKHGRQTIVWEAFHPNENVDKDITVLAWDGWNYPATKLIEAGYRTIHVPWTPSIYSTSRQLYNEWDPYNCHGNQLAPDAPLLGAMMVFWEQTDERTLPLLRMKAPIRQERIWNTHAGRPFEDMADRFTRADHRLDRLLYGFDIQLQGLNHPRDTWVDVGVDANGLNSGFARTLTVTLTPTIPGTVRYTLDGSDPMPQSPALNGPLTITDSVTLRARLFDDSGRLLGQTWHTACDYQPFVVSLDGTVSDTDHRFGKQATLTARAISNDGMIRYELDAAGRKTVTAQSPAVNGPIAIDRSQEVRMRYFDADGTPRGYTWSATFEQVDYDPTNITFGKPVTVSGEQYESLPKYAVDGVVQVKPFAHTYWAAQPAPQWIQVDLEQPVALSAVQVFTYWDEQRHYQYTVEVSIDGTTWTQVADMSANDKPATSAGVRHAFDPVTARYIRVTMLRSSANPGLHIVEIRAFEAK